PQYSGDTVHVLDASRSVTVAGSLMKKETREGFLKKIKNEYAALREQHSGRKQDKRYVSIRFARDHKFKIDWENYSPPQPSFTGNKSFDNFPLEKIRDHIDWTPFFQTWELYGKYPAILKDLKTGKEAQTLFDDANKLLDEVINKKLLTAKGVIGFYPAATVNDDEVEIATAGIHGREDNDKITFHFLRQ